jgi:hypothetical protein
MSAHSTSNPLRTFDNSESLSYSRHKGPQWNQMNHVGARWMGTREDYRSTKGTRQGLGDLLLTRAHRDRAVTISVV